MPSPLRKLISVAAGASLSLALTACGFCTDDACSTPFSWAGLPSGAESFPLGQYLVTVGVEDFEPVAVNCVLTGVPEDDRCSPTGFVENDDVAVAVSVGGSGLEVEVKVIAGTDDRTCKGPQTVAVAVTLDGTEIVAVEYDDLEYERDDRGEGCGFRDAPEFFQSDVEVGEGG